MKNELKVARRRLSNYELNVLLPILMKGLEMKKGKTNAVTTNQIIRAMRKHGLKISGRSVCMLINHIRTNDLIVGLMAASSGYYVSNNEQELINYEDSLMDREASIRRVRMSMQRQRRAMRLQMSQKQMQLF